MMGEGAKIRRTGLRAFASLRIFIKLATVFSDGHSFCFADLGQQSKNCHYGLPGSEFGQEYLLRKGERDENR